METQANTDPAKIEELLTRGVEEIFVKEHLKSELLNGKSLRIKLGIDPTSPAIHLGRAIPLRKLKAFQDLGHVIVLIIGDYTARIADPSDKLEKRPMLSKEEIQDNLKGYLEQIGKIIDLSKTEVRYNAEWFDNMNWIELGKLLESFTVQQMSRRRNFKERLEKGEDVFVVEFMYPAFQGYDSVMIKSDVEIGGFDQLFNLQAGRTVQKKYGQKEQDIMTLSMLVGTDGRKMSSSWGNVISLLDTADDMFGKVMAIKDDLMISYFTLCTDMSLQDISGLEDQLKSGANPKNIKTQLAHEIVRIYHGEDAAVEAQKSFENTFSKGGIPENITVIEAKSDEMLSDILVVHKIIESKTDFKRLVEEGAVSNMDTSEKISDFKQGALAGTYKIGKRRFVKIVN